MKRFIRRCVLSLVVVFLVFPSVGRAAQLPDIDRAEVERIIRVLADDDMEGRSAFSPATMRAAEFIAEQFVDIGLEQVPGNDGYLQRFTAAPRRRGRGRGGRAGGGGAGGGAAAPPEEYELANVVGMISGNRADEFVLWQLPRRHDYRQGRCRLRAPLRFLPRITALSRLTEPAGFSADGSTARRMVPIADDLPLRRRSVSRGRDAEDGTMSRRRRPERGR